MSVHSVFCYAFNVSSRGRYAGFCLMTVGYFLLLFCFCCTQCSWDAVRSFLRYFELRKNTIKTGAYVD